MSNNAPILMLPDNTAPIFWNNAADFKTLANQWIAAYMHLGELIEQLEQDREEIMDLMRKSLVKTKV